jgi:putative acetyltransferase
VFLRREGPDDRAAIFAIHATAFARPDGLVAPEAHLVDGLRDDGDIVPALSIVAESNNELVGHVVCSRATIDSYPSLGLGPLGVLPGHQRRGVGQALMHAVLAAADALDAPAVVCSGIPVTTGDSASSSPSPLVCIRLSRNGSNTSRSAV